MAAEAAEVHEGMDRLRAEMQVSVEHPVEVIREAEAAAADPRWRSDGRADRSAIDLVTIDPPGSRDLDQAFGAQRRDGGGTRVFYAIADVAAFVQPGDALDIECHQRGVTLYGPDGRAPLHPPQLSEGAASLLPDGDRPALLWTIDLDAHGTPVVTRFERAVVRSRAQLTYQDVLDDLAGGAPAEALVLLREIGELRQAAERERGGVSLPIPDQVVEPDGGHYRLAFDAPLPSEGWNAQISLLAGMEAARIMVEGGAGLLRTLPPADQRTLDRIRLAAQALDVDWPAGGTYPAFVRSLDPYSNAGAALLVQAARAFRGAGYQGFAASSPLESPLDAIHAAVAAPYAHVTAPLRRLCDRATNEIVLAHVEGRSIPDWAHAEIETLPKVMGDARRREGAYSRGAIDLVEALILRPHVGATFDGVVVDVDDEKDGNLKGGDGEVGDKKGGRAQLQLREPAVEAWARAHRAVSPGDDVHAMLKSADPIERRIELVIE